MQNESAAMNILSYTEGKWHNEGTKTDLISAVSGKPFAQMIEADLDYKSALEYARNVGGPKLREMTIHERAFKIKFLGQY
jgi:oxepin-CoA hydrolase/3-oxo-5,6-dehydrosuberyl-CoA semialdehyde dehydrogenase